MERASIEDVEVAIVGGGAAGLSAALVLGRCRRRVVVYDGGWHRNDETRAVHGFLTRDGVSPDALRDAARADLRAYPTVALRDERIARIERAGDGFTITPERGAPLRARRVVLATGVVDRHPPIEGVEALHGTRVLPCPYCDGWEHRDRPLGAYAHADDRGAGYAALLTQWSRDVTFYPGGPAALSAVARARLGRLGVRIDERAIARIAADGDGVRLHFRDGDSATRAALFYHLGCEPGTPLARQLGVAFDEAGGIVVDRTGATSVDGVYAAGDATRDVLQAMVGAGEGAAAAVAIDRAFARERWHSA